MKDFPLRQEDKALDDLASEARIRSLEDARTYVVATAKRFGLEEGRIAALKDVVDRLAKAEYAAVTDPSHRIPQSRIVTVFNKIMREFNAPSWARTSVDEVHGARVVLARVLLPHGVSRSTSGELSDAARPIEAIYALRLLEFQRRTPGGENQQVRPDGSTQEQSVGRFQPRQLTAEAIRRASEYRQGRLEYLAQQSERELTDKMQEVLTTLGIN